MEIEIQYQDRKGKDRSRTVNSPEPPMEEMEGLSRELEQEFSVPAGLDLVSPIGDRLTVVVSDNGCFASHYSASEDRTVTALGVEDGNEKISMFFGDYSLISRKFVISRKQVEEIIRSWWNSGELSPDVSWTEAIS